MILAKVDWSAVGVVGSMLVAAFAAVSSFWRGKKTDTQLGLAQDADRRSKETETNLTIQQGIIDQLQEEVGRYREELERRDTTLRTSRDELEETRRQLREMRHNYVEAKAGMDAAKVVIRGLERQVDTLHQQVATLENLIAGLKDLVNRHETTIQELRNA